MRSSVTFTINGAPYEIAHEEVPVTMSLLEYIRGKALLTGTKAGCGTGGCGACSVMVTRDRLSQGDNTYAATSSAAISSSPSSASAGIQKIREHVVVNACSTPVLALHGQNVTTVEGVGTLEAPHPVQTRFAQLHAQQCGFCTSGMVMSLYSLLMQNPQPKAVDVESVFSGNLCRCTGYRPILDAAKTWALDIEDLLSAKEAQRAGKDSPSTEGYYPPLTQSAVSREVSTSLEKIKQAKARGTVQPGLHLRPPSLSVFQGAGSGGGGAAGGAQAGGAAANPSTSPNVSTDAPSTYHGAGGGVWLYPANLEQYFTLTKQFPDFLFVAGNTTFGIARQTGQRDMRCVALVYTGCIRECTALHIDPASFDVTVGSSISLSTMADEFLVGNIGSNPQMRSSDPWMAAALREVAMVCQGVGSTQSRSTTTVLEHLLAQHGGELAPLLSVLKASGLVLSTEGKRKMTLCEMSGPAKILKPKDFVVELTIPSATNRFVGLCKGAMRHDNSSGVLILAMSCEVHRAREGDHIIAIDVRLCCNGLFQLFDMPEVALIFEGMNLMSDNSLRLRHAAEKFQHILRNMAFQPDNARLAYCMTLGKGFLFRLYCRLLATCNLQSSPHFDASTLNLDATLHPSVSEAVQSWEVTRGFLHNSKLQVVSSPNEVRSPVGDAVPNVGALPMTTGNAVYVEDVPTPQGCLFAVLVKSTIPKGVIKSINAEAAKAVAGVAGFFSYTDIPNKGLAKASPYKEHAFCEGEVVYIGDVVGVLVAQDYDTATRAAALVQIQYIPDPMPLFTIEDAISANSFYDFPNNQIVDGELEKNLHDKKYSRLAGTLCIGGQEHFYLEPHALLVIPGENQEIEIVSMTQCVTKTQNQVAQVLGIPASKVTVKVKRIGGAFGGKEVRTTYTSATLAVAATALRRPIRWRVDREEDMKITGGRHPYRAEWRVSFDGNGAIQALDVKLFSNGGCSDAVTSDAMTRSLMHITNAYKLPAVRVRGVLCRTNIVSNTAFRGFGAPQAMLVVDTVLEAVAQHVGVSVDVLRERHLIQPLSVTHYGQLVEHCKLPMMWKDLVTMADYANRKASIDAFNATSRWVKRGMAIVPTMYGISFPIEYLNQGGALVCAYADGSVAISHHAVEMGQGINTKVAQVAAKVLGVPLACIRVTECGSDKVPNTPPTAASMGSDLACMAVIDACEEIMQNLKPVRDKKGPTASFCALTDAAFKARIPLSATGFYKTSRGATYDWKGGTGGANGGQAYGYHVFGVGASEVELDVLTGHFKILRTDLLMDVGESINTQIDVGQVEGAFMQGMGWLTSEELVFGDSQHPGVQPPGSLHNASSNGYLIPTAFDVPNDFRVSFLAGAPNPFAVHGSKAVGEPPLYLAATVPFAIKDAIYAARAAEQLTGFLSLDFPLTSERIRMACKDDFTLGTFSVDEYKAAGSF